MVKEQTRINNNFYATNNKISEIFQEFPISVNFIILFHRVLTINLYIQ